MFNIYLAVSSCPPLRPSNGSVPLADDTCDLAPFNDDDDDDDDARAKEDVAAAESIGPLLLFTLTMRNSSL